jgi:WD40 repeat protein
MTSEAMIVEHLSTAEHGCPVAKLRLHPREPLLASVAGPEAEVIVWAWDDAGRLRLLDRIRRPQGGRVSDVAWHPTDRALALVGGGGPIELWSEGGLLRPLGARPVAGQKRPLTYGISVGGGPLKIRRKFQVVPEAEQGYHAVAFSARGDRLAASRIGGGAEEGDPTEVYDLATGALIGTFWTTDTTLALHPEGELLATLSSNQGASAVRFVRLDDPLRCYNAQLNVIIDGYRRLVWSPRGDAFAVMGHSYGVGVRAFEFPSCRLVYEEDFESWDDVYGRLWAEFRGAERFEANPDGSFPFEFVDDLWTVNDRLSFHPDGHTLLVGTMDGVVVGVDLDDTTAPVRAGSAHDGPVLALDACPRRALLATARHDGQIKLWRLDAEPAPAPVGLPMTERFLQMFQPIDPTAPEEQFRLTDGKRWYDLATIGDEELDDDAPPWAQIAKIMHEKRREEL